VFTDFILQNVTINNNNIEIYKAHKVSELNLRHWQSLDG